MSQGQIAGGNLADDIDFGVRRKGAAQQLYFTRITSVFLVVNGDTASSSFHTVPGGDAGAEAGIFPGLGKTDEPGRGIWSA